MAATSRTRGRQPITVFAKDLNDRVFYEALNKIDCSPVLTGDAVWAFADFKQACDDLHKKVEKQYMEMLFQHVVMEPIISIGEDGEAAPAKDPNGADILRPKVIRDDNGRVTGYVLKNEQEFAEARDTLLGQSITSELIPLTSKEAAEIGLTPRELRAIRHLIKDAPPEPVRAPEVYSS